MSRNANKRLLRLRSKAAADFEIEIEDGETEEQEARFEREINRMAKGAEIEQPGESTEARLFIPIEKVDIARREVWGTAADETPDHAGEIFDYASSIPLFNAWSENAYKRSGGKSRGNVRSMHQAIAAGKLVHFQGDPQSRSLQVGAKIVDDAEWRKVTEGVYTGFSIGGKYKKRWYDDRAGAVRYTAEPSEISIVDAPCNEAAVYSVVKEDGTTELRKFAAHQAEPADVEKAVPGAQTPAKTTVAGQTYETYPAPTSEVIFTQDNPPAGERARNLIVPGQAEMTGEAPNLPGTVPAVEPQAHEGEAAGPALEYTSTGLPHPAQKAVQDAPGLMHSTGPAYCSGCQFYRWFGSKEYCWRYDFLTQSDWICDSWHKAGDHPDAYTIVAQEQMAAEGDASVVEDAAKAAAGEDKEKALADLEARGKKVGIARRDGEPLTPPKNYPTDPAAYGDPANWGWPVTEERYASALAYYNGGKGRDKYSSAEWSVLGRRIARMAEAVAGRKYKFDPREKKITPIQEASKMTQKTDFSAMAAKAREMLEAGSPEGLDQAKAMLDVMVDQAQRPMPEQQVQGAAVDAKPSPEVTPQDSSAPSSAEKTAVPASETSTPGKSTPTFMESDTKPAQPAQKGTNDQMSDERPFATTPPAANIPMGDDYYINSRIEGFNRALEAGSVSKALGVADGDRFLFDRLFMRSCYELAQKAGFKTGNEAAISTFGKMIFGAGVTGGDDLAKGLNSSFAPGIYLQRLVKLMLPVLNPWRKRVGTQQAPVGATAAQWRAQLGFQNVDFAAALYNVPEAGTTIGSTTGSGQAITETSLTFASPFARIAFNNLATLEAVATSRGFDDPITIAVIQALTALLKAEETKLLIDNYAAVARPAAVTATPDTVGGTLATNTYTVKVTSLTGIGWMKSTVAGFAGSGLTGQQGESANRASAGTSVTGPTGKLTCSWASVPGAVAYNVYLYDATNEYFVATVTRPSIVITAMPGAGQVAPTADTTANANGIEGVTQWCALSTVYGNAIPNKVVVDAGGAGLTLTGPNSISQIDSILRQLFTYWQIAPTLIMCSPKSAEYMAKIVGSGTNPPYRIETQGNQGSIVGGMFATGYLNKYAQYIEGLPTTLPILSHPYLPDGNFYFLSESIPYPMSREARGWMVETLIPYTYFPFGAVSFNYPFGMIVSETEECYHPGAQAALLGVDVSL